MNIKAGNISINAEIDESLLGKGLIPLLFLHGFTGSALEWKIFFDKIDNRFLPFSIDLIGHGLSDAPESMEHYSARAIAEQIDAVFNRLNFNKVVLCGYSMGGRAALSYFSYFPEKIAGLILESSTAGIEETQLREDRIKSDELMARKIEVEGVEKFGSYWVNLPMFSGLKSLPADEYQKILKTRMNNNQTGLINSLKGFGTGSMPVLWDRLRDINVPALLITGEFDDKFTQINERMKDKILKVEHHIIRDCGHNTHLQKPEVFIKLVNNFLTSNFIRV